MGRRVLKFDGPLARGLWYRPSDDEFYITAFGAKVQRVVVAPFGRHF